MSKVYGKYLGAVVCAMAVFFGALTVWADGGTDETGAETPESTAESFGPVRKKFDPDERASGPYLKFKHGVWWTHRPPVPTGQGGDENSLDLPDSGAVDVVVMGDSLGDGIWAGLRQEFEDLSVFDLEKRSRASTGLVRLDYYDWIEGVDKLTDDTSIDVAVVVFGANDRQVITKDGEQLDILGDAWKKEYADRIDRFTEKLKGEAELIVWVGMPVMGPTSYSRDIEKLNEVYSSRAEANDIEYVSTWDATADANGNFREYARVAGAKRRIRADDGVHFTWYGYRIVAEPVADTVFRAYGLNEEGQRPSAEADSDDEADESGSEKAGADSEDESNEPG